MALHFSVEEFARRRAAAIAAMEREALDGILLFRQESMYYLTGYDTFGYVFFQCLYLGADGRMMLLTRAPDRLQALHTSVIDDIRIWVDAPDANPSLELREILRAFGCNGKRIGVEWEAYGLTARNGRRLAAALDGFCELADASELVSRLRLIKSPAELEHVRVAARLADDAFEQAVQLSGPGAFEGDILAAMQAAVIRGDGDDPANEFVIGSGPDALLCRYKSGRRVLENGDQLTLEFAGVFRHYHVCHMRTFAIGNVDPRVVELNRIAVEALLTAEAALRPGRPLSDVFDAYVRVMEQSGHGGNRLNACGYSLGATFAPNWMDWPMIYRDSRIEVQPGMTFFIPIVLLDSRSGLAMTLGRTLEVTQQKANPLSRIGLDLVVR